MDDNTLPKEQWGRQRQLTVVSDKKYPAAFILMLIPFVSAFFYGVVGEDKFLLLSPLTIVGYVCLAGWMVKSAFSKRSGSVAPPSFFPLLVFMAYGAVIGSGSVIPYEAKIRMLLIGLFIGAYYVWGNSLALFRRSRNILGWVMLFALLGCFYGLVNHFKSPEQVLWMDRYYVYTGRLASTYICPNHFAHLLQMLLPFCLVLILIPKAGLFLRILSGYCIVVYVPTLCLTESRAGMLGAVVALGVTTLLLSLRKSKKLFLLLLVVVPLLSILLLAGAWNYSEMFKRRMTPMVNFIVDAKTEGFSDTNTKDFRPLTWIDSVEMIKAKPRTGFGPASYRYIFPEYRNRYRGVRVVTGHPHNEYLEVASEYGLIGFGLFAVAWCYGLIRLLVFSLRTSQQHHAFMAMAFLGTAAGTMLHSFFDFQMHVFQNALIFSLLGGIAAGPLCGRRLEELGTKRSGRRRVGLGLLALVMVFGMVLASVTFSSAFMRAKADRMVETGKIDKAIALYNIAIKVDAKNWRAYKGLGFLYANERRHILEKTKKQAMAILEADMLAEGYIQNPMDAELVVALGKVELFLRNRVRGLELLQYATQLRPFNDNVWWIYGVELRKAERYDDALETFLDAAQIKRTLSIRENIQWLEKQLKGDFDEDNIRIPTQKSGVIQQSDKAISLDDLHGLMDSK